MKNLRFILGFIIGFVISCGITVFATATLLGTNVFYDNKDTTLTSDNVQNAVDELYDRFVSDTCYTKSKTKYTESILNGADPVLGQNMIPVTIDKNGKVYYANVNSPWYEYGQKIWANAVMLIDNPSKTYKECEEISNSDIKAYFVWVPRYKYKIWNTGNYNSAYSLSDLVDTTTDIDTSLRKVANNSRTIEVVFENKTTTVSNGSTVGSYLTHPAFTSFNANGLWVGKFETTGSLSNLTVKPSEIAVTNQTVSSLWNSLYNFNRTNDFHMIKNTEWGAVAYLSHSQYGINKEITINNNESNLTGYAAAPNTDQTSFPGESGTTSDKTLPWITIQGQTASTTGNINGIYDMNGGIIEYVAAYLSGYGVRSSGDVDSGFASDPATQNGAKYFDVYTNSINKFYGYNNRKLGDATGEMGPFYIYSDKSSSGRAHNAWYGDYSYFIVSTYPWFFRGGTSGSGSLSGQFHFHQENGRAMGYIGSRLVLAPQ